MVDLNDLTLFVQVVRAGSFTKAAGAAGLPANTVSRRIQSLEEHLGTLLLQRSTRRLKLTDAGQRLYDRSVEQIDSLASTVQALLEAGQSPSGRVRIAAPADFFNWYDMAWTAEFLARFPRVKLEFVLADDAADLLEEGIDVAFRGGDLTEPSLVARRIGKNSTCLVASPAYLAARGVPDSPAALAEHDCLTMLNPSGRTTWHLDRADPQPATAKVEVSGKFAANASQALLKASLAGLGIALLPTLMTEPHISSGELDVVLPGYQLHGSGLSFVYLSRRHLLPAVSTFIDFTIGKIEQQGLIERQ